MGPFGDTDGSFDGYESSPVCLLIEQAQEVGRLQERLLQREEGLEAAHMANRLLTQDADYWRGRYETLEGIVQGEAVGAGRGAPS